MGTTKTGQYPPELLLLADHIKAIGHPARLAIVGQLAKTSGCICGDFVSELPLAQPTVSQHLKELKQNNWISGEVSGNSVCYCLNTTTVKQVYDLLGKWLEMTKNDCC
jgi:ArsR family transcriptional regulator, arsenate/arsenite/antimonite-responsive transcriptional repressor